MRSALKVFVVPKDKPLVQWADKPCAKTCKQMAITADHAENLVRGRSAKLGLAEAVQAITIAPKVKAWPAISHQDVVNVAQAVAGQRPFRDNAQLPVSSAWLLMHSEKATLRASFRARSAPQMASS
jgi:hypothetical protein